VTKQGKTERGGGSFTRKSKWAWNSNEDENETVEGGKQSKKWHLKNTNADTLARPHNNCNQQKTDWHYSWTDKVDRWVYVDIRKYTVEKWYCLTLIVLGKVKVGLSDFDAKFWTKFWCIGFFINTYFWTSDIMSKNNILTYFLMYFRQKSSCGATLSTTPLPVGFTAITDHPKAREVSPGCGL
jgi:hypothetical protein